MARSLDPNRLEDLAQAGFRAFAEKGFRRTQMADVARELYPDSTIRTDELDETFTFTPTFVGKDGERYDLETDEVADIARAHFAHSVLLKWRRGDLLLMDNFRIVHGRLNAGEPRKVLQVVLCDYVRNRSRFTR